MRFIQRLAFMALLGASCIAPPAQAGVVLSAGLDTALDNNALKRAWLEGRVNGARVKVIDRHEGEAVRSAFYKSVCGLDDEKKIRVHWATALFRGEATTPVVLDTDAAVLEYLHTHPNAIGYFETAPADSGLHVLARY